MHIYRLKLGIISLLLAIGLLAPALVTGQVSAQISQGSKDAACEGLGAGNCDGSAGSSVSGLLASGVNILSWIVGLVAIFMVIIGGFKFVISSGDAAGIASARNTVIYALVGLAVAALAQVLVRFVLSKV